MTDKKTRKTFTDEFKKEAILLISQQGYSFAQAAEAIGVREDYLRRWKKAFDTQAAPDALSEQEREELRRLRRENKQLKMEKEILKNRPLETSPC